MSESKLPLTAPEPLNDGFLDLTIDTLHRYERGEYQDPLKLKAYIGFALQVCRAEKRRREETT